MNLRPLDRIGVRLGLAVAGVLLLLAVTTTALTGNAFDRATRSVQDASVAELEALARNSLLEITEREAQIIAGSLEHAAVASRSAAGYLAQRMERSNGDEVQARLTELPSGHWLDPDPLRRTTVHVPAPAASRESVLRDVRTSLALDELLPSLAPELGDGVGIYFVTPDGVTRYYPPIDFHRVVEPEFDPTVQPVYRLGTPEANPDRTTRWTPPYVDDVGNGLLVTAVTPVWADGEFRGVLDVDVSLERLATRLAGLSPLPGSFALLVDGDGRLIAASPGAAHRLPNAADLAFGAPLRLTTSDGSPAFQAGQEPGIATIPLQDDPLVLAHAPLPGLGWSLAIGAPASAVNAPAREIAAGVTGEARLARRGSVVASLVAFLLALGVLMVATRRWVAMPIASLAAGTRRLSAGEFGVALPLGARSEFRELGEAFNRMSSDLADGRQRILDQQRDLERQVAERTRELGHLLAISSDLGAVADAPSLMRSVLTRLHDAVPFASGAAWLLEGEEARRIAMIGGRSSDSTPGAMFASTLRDLPARLDDGRPILLDGREGRVAARVLAAADAESLLLVPLTHRGRTLGIVALAGPVMDEAHGLDLVGAVAQQLGSALDNARLLRDARERSALEERQHLARELHDSVSQALFGVVLGLHTAQKEIGNTDRLRSAIDYASELADAALKEMRALIFELRPEALEAEGLTGLLRRQAEMLKARHELKVDLDVEEPALSLDAKAALYRVAQEALHNVVKHAGAERVRLTLRERDGAVLLEVRDDGRGFGEDVGGGESYGLHTMRERMALLGGRLTLSSRPGGGTLVTAELPSTAAPV